MNPSRLRAFKQVDVFTSVPFKGNPVAVVLDAEGLSADEMQQIAAWTNLSETTFVLPPGDAQADYRVRIFTPKAELPFAGHPTIGTAHALLEAGRIRPRDGRLVQACQAGLVTLSVQDENDGRWIAFDLPEPRIKVLNAAQIADLEAVLGCTVRTDKPPRIVDVGPRWLVAQLGSAREVLGIHPALSRMRELDSLWRTTGVTVFGEHEPGGAAHLEVRSFVPSQGIDEDPVCGSGNGCVAAFIRDTGQVAQLGTMLVAAQGARVGRAGRIRLEISADVIRVGGQSITCMDGVMPV